MKYLIPTIVSALLVTACSTPKEPSSCDYTKLVNPFIGTDYTGNTYPGAQVPFGMVQMSPDNGLPGWDRIAGYFYPDSTIAGFSHTHLSGTGAGDLYDISFLPVT
ncbi:MAG: glycoside hydrolase family 92 protein, partial [Bacteroidales bacterium]|nr:glycoside hydrolase family 92 protein [Bacteroidales bacterium]